MGSSRKHSQRYYMRMKFQERQFLRAQDFQDEQDYHALKLMDHNRLLHTRGICEGLTVTASTADNKCVNVSKGSAIDFDGNQILLTDTETVDLSKATAAKVILTVCYGEANATDAKYNLDEGGFKGCTRTLEKPLFEAWPYATPSADPNKLLLAIIDRDANGKITAVDTNPPAPQNRLEAGVKLSNVGSATLVDQSVTTEKIRDGAVTAIKIAGSAVTRDKIANGEVVAGKLATDAVVAGNIAANAVITAKIADGNVTTAKLPDNAVTTAKINNLAITEAKLGAGAVTEAKIANKAVTLAKMNCERVSWGEVTLSANGGIFSGTSNYNDTDRLCPYVFFVQPLDYDVSTYNSYTKIDGAICWFDVATKLSSTGLTHHNIRVTNYTTVPRKVIVYKWRWS